MNLLYVLGKHIFLYLILIFFPHVLSYTHLTLMLLDVRVVAEVVDVVASFNEIFLVGSMHLNWIGLLIDIDVVRLVAVDEFILPLLLNLFDL